MLPLMHDIPLRMLEVTYGIRGQALQCLNSFFTDRSQTAVFLLAPPLLCRVFYVAYRRVPFAVP